METIMAKAQPAMLTEENTPKVKKLPTIKRKTNIDAWIVVLENQVLITQLTSEIDEETQEREWRITKPFIVNGTTLQPYLSEYTFQNSFVINSKLIVTLAKPNAELQEKYENLIQE